MRFVYAAHRATAAVTSPVAVDLEDGPRPQADGVGER